MRAYSAVRALERRLASNAAVGSAKVSVAAIPGGWSVASSFSESPLVFQSGARAEQAGLQLAEAAVKAGLAVELRIRTRDGQVAMHTLSAATPHPGPGDLGLKPNRDWDC